MTHSEIEMLEQKLKKAKLITRSIKYWNEKVIEYNEYVNKSQDFNKQEYWNERTKIATEKLNSARVELKEL